MTMTAELTTLKFFIDGQARWSESGKYADISDPSSGRVIARTPLCTEEEVNLAIQSAKDAFPAWADTPAMKRVQILYKFRDLIDKHLDELTRLVCTENGKVWEEAMGDVLKAKEVVEID